jgi:hypothetical protein
MALWHLNSLLAHFARVPPDRISGGFRALYLFVNHLGDSAVRMTSGVKQKPACESADTFADWRFSRLLWGVCYLNDRSLCQHTRLGSLSSLGLIERRQVDAAACRDQLNPGD